MPASISFGILGDCLEVADNVAGVVGYATARTSAARS
ncbi:hypothetical protein BDK92_0345 [Micromonospora pisi]|uniref:Uncharacterized protein n=1 Tax=Micromonospora pisi TaxID=589240 RepID=A0A495JBB0_9ACTN|nr:hypothetical protein BDK92_0345 [Micromonospora pisi]